MLWRNAYQTRIERDLLCPVSEIITLDGTPVKDQAEVWVAGFGFQALTEQGVWWRLFQSDFPNDLRVKKVFICSTVGKSELETALSLVPPSETARVLLVSDPNEFWSKAIQPANNQQGFTAILESGKIPLVMVGPPTEDAWEEFHNEWKVRT